MLRSSFEKVHLDSFALCPKHILSLLTTPPQTNMSSTSSTPSSPMPSRSSTSTSSPMPLDNSIYTPPLTKLPESKSDKFSRAQLLMELVTQLRSGKDAWKISLPCQLLAPASMLEYMSYFVTPNEYILGAAKKMDPEQRFLDVVKWWLSNMTKAPAKGIYHSKPYNPALGEVFSCQFQHADGSKTYYLSEQTSHHPPVSAFYMTNRQANFVCKATFQPKTKFHGNSASNVMEGPLKCYILNHNEEYEVRFPNLCAYGLLLGSQRIEVNDTMSIECASTGYKCDINFKAKSGNKLKATITHEDKKIYKLSGILDEKIHIKSLTNKKASLFLDATELQQPDVECRPLEKQAPNESRLLWHNVTYNIRKLRDFNSSNEYKKEIEQEQRELRTSRKEPWEPRFFRDVSVTDAKKDIQYQCVFENLEPYSEDEGDFIKNTDKIFDVNADLSGGL